MSNNNSQPNLTSSQIVKATIIALVTSFVLAIVAVLPAEYGKDYTGLGKILGFSRLHQNDDEVEQKLAKKEVAISIFKELTLNNVGSSPEVEKPVEANNPAPIKQYESRKDSIKIMVPAGKGLEYKIALLKYGQVKYSWKTNNGVLFVDLHGDVKNANNNTDYFESYTVANSNNMAGSFIAPYEGKHGWYFKNKSDQDIEVSINLIGEYQLINQ
ncbi:hypothetical protein [Flavobacterium laiguense]|uniref:Transmembrane anchor protein n=1 Tax=Flavobacterium laiguense TaxID=2169409 RepID=A0A2U1JUF5_9FLAO|nr:hypothetical protein [Flavobacterium laiguense]PWA08831.1 hypothetical protein DB891_10430 [Flavobacterium laiguense]